MDSDTHHKFNFSDLSQCIVIPIISFSDLNQCIVIPIISLICVSLMVTVVSVLLTLESSLYWA